MGIYMKVQCINILFIIKVLKPGFLFARSTQRFTRLRVQPVEPSGQAGIMTNEEITKFEEFIKKNI